MHACVSQDQLQLLQHFRQAHLPLLIHRDVFLHVDCPDPELGHDHRILPSLHALDKHGGQRGHRTVHGQHLAFDAALLHLSPFVVLLHHQGRPGNSFVRVSSIRGIRCHLFSHYPPKMRGASGNGCGLSGPGLHALPDVWGGHQLLGGW